MYVGDNDQSMGDQSGYCVVGVYLEDTRVIKDSSALKFLFKLVSITFFFLV